MSQGIEGGGVARRNGGAEGTGYKGEKFELGNGREAEGYGALISIGKISSAGSRITTQIRALHDVLSFELPKPLFQNRDN